VWGPVIGTIVLTVVTYYAEGWWPGYESLISAALMVAVILFLRGGLVGTAEKFRRLTRSTKNRTEAVSE
jgi:ABC-type branched-subunit amino acid transport system permease subunit